MSTNMVTEGASARARITDCKKGLSTYWLPHETSHNESGYDKRASARLARSEEAGMSFWKQLVFPFAMATSLIVGPVVMTAALVGYHWIVARPLLSDGQYALFFVITVPSGAAAALAACAAAGNIRPNRNRSGWICLIGGFLTLAPAVLYDAAVALNASATGQWSSITFLEGVWNLLPIFAAGVALMVAGLVIRRNPSRE